MNDNNTTDKKPMTLDEFRRLGHEATKKKHGLEFYKNMSNKAHSSMTPEQRKERAQKAAAARWEKDKNRK